MSSREPFPIGIRWDDVGNRYVVDPAVAAVSRRETDVVVFTNHTATILEVALPNGFFDGDSVVLGPGDSAVLRIRLRPAARRVFEYSVFAPLANMAAEGGSAPKMILDP